MIGGYIGKHAERWIEKLIGARSIQHIAAVGLSGHGANGYLFCSENSTGRAPSGATLHLSPQLAVVSEDLLVIGHPDSDYHEVDVGEGFAQLYQQHGRAAFEKIVSDFRMVVVDFTASSRALYLVSDRAGSGRMCFERTGNGIAFCSDIRVLLATGPREISDVALYAILKYGAVPEPMTICATIRAVPVGHYARFDLPDFSLKIEPYFKFRFAYGDTDSSAECDVSALDSSRRVLRASAEFLGEHGLRY